MDQNLKWAKEPDLYWLQAPLLKEPKNSPLVHYPVYYHRRTDSLSLKTSENKNSSSRFSIYYKYTLGKYYIPSYL